MRSKLQNRTIVIIIVISLIITGLYLTTLREENFSEVEQQSKEQLRTTMKIVNHLESDFNTVKKNLELIAEDTLLESYLTEAKKSELIEYHFEKINEITPIVAIFITDTENLITHNINHDRISYKDADLSSREYVKNVRSKMNTEFSTGFVGLDGKYQITIAEPITDSQEKYSGLVGVVLHAQEFFKHYRNLGNLQNESLLILDRNHNIIAADEIEIIGMHFTESKYYKDIPSRDLFNLVFEGMPSKTIYPLNDTYKILTGEPVRLNGNDEYFIFIIN